MLSVMSILCELCMTTETVNAESQKNWTDCDMVLDKITNV